MLLVALKDMSVGAPPSTVHGPATRRAVTVLSHWPCMPQPWGHLCSCFPGALEKGSLALGRDALRMSCKRSFNSPYLCNRTAEAFVSQRGQSGLTGLSL